MCGRYQRRSDKQRIAEAFELGALDGLFLELTPNYNIAPHTMQPVIVWDSEQGMRTLQMMYWRFLPSFCTDPKTFKLDTINAKADKLLESRMWRSAFLHNRCLIPADSFVEWERLDMKSKLPFMFAMRNDEPFALGGVWRRWHSADGKTEMDTFAVVTTDPNELVAATTHHDRMPVIIRRSDFQRWLEPIESQEPPTDLLRPFNPEEMKAWRVDQRINSVKANDASLGDPAPEPEQKRQLSIFGEEQGA